jgi:branched-chain amino acid transport system ATP-binding protein
MGIRRGSFIGIIGPNGAGKTTLLNAISGLCQVSHGSVTFEGKNITNAKAFKIARAGVGRTFQGVQLVAHMTAIENVMIGRYTKMHGNIVSTGLGLRRPRREEHRARELALEALSLVGGSSWANKRADQLPYGQQKLVELARSAMLEPTLLLLDEPSSGMTRTEKDAVVNSVLRIREATGATVAIIEHDVALVRRACDELVVMQAGKVIGAGATAKVLDDPLVQEAYLGIKSTPTNLPDTSGERSE